MHRSGQPDETTEIAHLSRPLDSAAVADFGLSLVEARAITQALQQCVTQSQVYAYDRCKRHCFHCGAYRKIKDWRQRVIRTASGDVRLRVPRVHSCQCLEEPMDDDGEWLENRFTECHIERLLPKRMTPELEYLCAKQGASMPYRSAADQIRSIAGLRSLTHACVRQRTMNTGQNIEDRQFEVGCYAGGPKRKAAKHLHLAIDSTFVSAARSECTQRFEVLAGRIVRDGQMARRFVCVVRKQSLAHILVRAALDQSGWVARTQVEVVNDGASGMRAIVEYAAPRVAAPMLDWFHVGMKLRAIETPLKSKSVDYVVNAERPVLIELCVHLWKKIRAALWRGRAAKAMELGRTLVASIEEEFAALPEFYASSVSCAHRATERLIAYIRQNEASVCDYHRARQSGRSISTAQAESVMNHLINRRVSKKQQMRWSMKGAHEMLLTRVEMLDGRLEQHFRERYRHFRSPEFANAG